MYGILAWTRESTGASGTRFGEEVKCQKTRISFLKVTTRGKGGNLKSYANQGILYCGKLDGKGRFQKQEARISFKLHHKGKETT